MLAVFYAWWFWMAMAMIFLLPLGYGWGYRGWGVPYPSYLQRQRMERARTNGVLARYDYQAWGRVGDLLWVVLLGDILLVALILLWH